MNRRMTLQDTILPVGGGKYGRSPILVKKGEIVETHNRVCQRDRDIWGDDADEFVPERWETARVLWEFIPLHGGPRICPAQQQVYVEAAYVIVRLMLEFETIENRDPVHEWQEQMRMPVQSRNGVKVGLFKDHSGSA
ncbi:hypothetical protein MMC25_004179 [Agyrium rufum]|nr:hypothetical protein [Agyrium rufum]